MASASAFELWEKKIGSLSFDNWQKLPNIIRFNSNYFLGMSGFVKPVFNLTLKLIHTTYWY